MIEISIFHKDPDRLRASESERVVHKTRVACNSSPLRVQEEDRLRASESETVVHDKCAGVIRCIVMYLMYCAQLAHSHFDLFSTDAGKIPVCIR
jgi:hypothetical protein